MRYLRLFERKFELMENRQFTLTSFKDNPALLKHLIVKDGQQQFDFSMSKAKVTRSGRKYYQLGDISLAIRKDFDTWSFYNSKDDQTFESCPLDIVRNWKVLHHDQEVDFSISLGNSTKDVIEIGGLGMAMIFNQFLTGNTLDESHNNCVFVDPYIGNDAGYLQGTRLSGDSPTLLVTSKENAHFEAYRPLHDDQTKLGVTFEGFYEWTIFSKAYAQQQWYGKRQWNKPTSMFLKPGESQKFTLRFTAVNKPAEIPEALNHLGIPCAKSIPGYVIHGEENATLTIDSNQDIKRVEVNPIGALSIFRKGDMSFSIKRAQDYLGQADVLITYQDGSKQTINYMVLESAQSSVKKLAEFHVAHQWLDEPDQFNRQHSFITYDRDAHKKVLNDPRVFISGVSDEVGAGPNLLMAMKNWLMPNKEQIRLLEEYIDDVLWGHLQNKDNYSIRASLKYAGPDSQYSWAAWDKKRSEDTWRAYNYPHQAAIYWVMYQLARNYDGLVTNHDWKWYLLHAYRTVMAMHEFCGPNDFLYLEQFGLMVGSIHLRILGDLKKENLDKEAANFENYMKERYSIWQQLKYPYGSEMPWDSTGQEEIYTWCHYFGDKPKSKQTVDAVLAYTPSIPHWGYNGAARRYFDSFVYGKSELMVRLFGHYGSTLNAIPILDSYKADRSDDLYYLKVGYAASTSALTMIDRNGFGSMGFMADPAVMDFEPYTGDYGQSFYGYAYEAGQFVHYDATSGWGSFGGNLELDQNIMLLEPLDAFKKRIFIHSYYNNIQIVSETLPIKNVLGSV